MLTPWTLCLLSIGVAGALLLRPNPAWWRSFAAMLAASIAGKVFADPAAWVLIDLAAAATVIFPPRKGFQKVIAAGFAGMMIFELGWLLSERMNAHLVVNAGSFCGWLQLAALLMWGIDERYGTSRILGWLIGPDLARARIDAP